MQYDLKEGRASAQQAALYAKNHDTADFAEKIMWLLDHEEESASMAEYGYERVINQLSWDHESSKLINFYAKVLGVTLKESASISV